MAKAVKKIVAKDADQYMLRPPPGMRDAVATLATANGRSMNTEIIAAVEQHLKGPSRLDRMQSSIKRHEQRIHDLTIMVATLNQTKEPRI